MKITTIIALIFLSFSVYAVATERSIVIEKVINVYDGDTFKVKLKDCNISIICDNLSIRLAGSDAPELKAKCSKELDKANQAKQYLTQRFKEATTIRLADIKRDKYFRLRARVLVDGSDVGEEMIFGNLARPYEGGKRQSWC